MYCIYKLNMFDTQTKHVLFIYCSTSSWIRPKLASIGKSHRRSSTLRAWMRNNIGLIFFWSLYSFICTCICIDILHFYVGVERAHVFIVIARLNGTKKNTNFLFFFYFLSFRWYAVF